MNNSFFTNHKPTAMEKKVMSPQLKGLLISLIFIVMSLVMLLTIKDLKKQNELGWISWILIPASIIWACIYYARQMDGNVTFGNVFAHGFKTSGVLALIMVAFTLLYVFVIVPDFKDQMMDISREEMAKNPDLTEEQIEQAVGFTEKFFSLFVVLGALFTYLIFGVVGSLIGAAVAKKNPNPNPF
jgi:predicted membrane channel-forming protein YqfA (hemolysin III family)